MLVVLAGTVRIGEIVLIDFTGEPLLIEDKLALFEKKKQKQKTNYLDLSLRHSNYCRTVLELFIVY